MSIELIGYELIISLQLLGSPLLFWGAYRAYRTGEHIGILFMILSILSFFAAGDSARRIARGETGRAPRSHHALIARLIMVLALLGTTIGVASAEEPSAPVDHTGLTAGGLFDGYWDYDFEDPFTEDRQYTTQALRHNQARVNLGMLQAKLDEDRWRGRLAIQAGDSVKANYAAEKEEFWRYIQESSVGYRIAEGLWIEGGIYLSHIGLESFNSPDNWNYTRSLVAEYSPYYESGVKLSYAIDDQWSAQAHILNGWQNITQDQDPAFGGQLQYTPDSSLQLTYANFLGNQNGFRNFHDFVVKRSLTDRLSIAAELDIGNQNLENGGGNVWWHGWTVVGQYKLIPDSLHLGARVERYSDPHQVVLSTLNGESFEGVGLSVNIDYRILPGLWWRNEFRYLTTTHDVFPEDDEGEFGPSDNLFVTSLSYVADFGRLLP